jgi:hypothetical protein
LIVSPRDTEAAAARFGIQRSSLRMILPASSRLSMRPIALGGAIALELVALAKDRVLVPDFDSGAKPCL